MPAVVRPYPFKLAGNPLTVNFDALNDDKTFMMRFEQDPVSKTSESEFFVPLGVHYPRGVDIEVSDGSYKLDEANQTLTFTHDPKVASHWICIRHKSSGDMSSSRTPATKFFASSPMLEARA
mmetsp:Transcript_10233/g.8538  ORF Transcript_10233/g.8538 Transcript_10233/m.8538 type:complete len:122 (-) Transcript_10233:306-671(-)